MEVLTLLLHAATTYNHLQPLATTCQELHPLLTYFLVEAHLSLATPARLTYYEFLVGVRLSGYLAATRPLLTY